MSFNVNHILKQHNSCFYTEIQIKYVFSADHLSPSNVLWLAAADLADTVTQLLACLSAVSPVTRLFIQTQTFPLPQTKIINTK